MPDLSAWLLTVGAFGAIVVLTAVAAKARPMAASKSAVSGVCSAGLATTVQPAARAGAMPRAAVDKG